MSGARLLPGMATEEFTPYQSDEIALDHAVVPAERGVLGRTRELEALESALRTAFSERKPCVVVLEGPRGSGTTRLLIHSAHLAVRADGDIRLAHGICVEGRDGEFAPFPRLLLDRLSITPSSAETTARARVTTEVAEALGTADAVDVSRAAHLVGHVAGVEFPDSPFLRGAAENPGDLRARAIEAVARFIDRSATTRPVWLGLDNAHQMEAAAWEIVDALAKCSSPIAIVCAGQTGTAEAARRYVDPSKLIVIQVGPLSEAEVGELVRRLLPELEDLPEPLLAAIAHRSRGLPSEVRQLVFSLVEGELFVRDAQGRLHVDLERMERGELPITMDDALLARLVRLDRDERELLEFAAICGEIFWDGALLCQQRMERPESAPSIDQDDPETDAQEIAQTLTRLVEKGFVAPVTGSGVVPANEFRFAHPRTRAIVYAAIPDELRRARHLAVARWLDIATAKRRDVVGATVGFHLELAGMSAAAGMAYARAATLERSQRRLDRALHWIGRAEACIPADDPMALIDLAHERGVVLVSLSRYEEAIAAFERMYQLSRRLGARGKQAAALDRIARAQLTRGSAHRALPLLERALALGRLANDRRGIASCLDDLAQVELVLGRGDRAQMAATEALEVRRAIGDPRGESVSLTTLGRIALRRGQLAMAEERLRGALLLREGLNDVDGMVQTLTALGRVAFERADRDGAVEIWQRALPQARQIGDRRAELALLSHLGEAYGVLGKLAAAEQCLVHAKELAIAIDDKRSIARIDALLGRVAVRRGDERALRLLKLAIDAAEAANAPDVLGLALRAMGQHHALRASKDPDAAKLARHNFERSIDAFGAARSAKEKARSMLDLAHLLVERGDREGAKKVLEDTRPLIAETQLPELAVVDQMLATLGR